MGVDISETPFLNTNISRKPFKITTLISSKIYTKERA
jgi:hypothetical protein